MSTKLSATEPVHISTRPRRNFARLRSHGFPVPTLLPFTSFRLPQARKLSASSPTGTPTHQQHSNTHQSRTLTSQIKSSVSSFRIQPRSPSFFPYNSRPHYHQPSRFLLPPHTNTHLLTLGFALPSFRARSQPPDTNLSPTRPLSLSALLYLSLTVSSPNHPNVPCSAQFLLAKQQQVDHVLIHVGTSLPYLSRLFSLMASPYSSSPLLFFFSFSLPFFSRKN